MGFFRKKNKKGKNKTLAKVVVEVKLWNGNTFDYQTIIYNPQASFKYARRQMYDVIEDCLRNDESSSITIKKDKEKEIYYVSEMLGDNLIANEFVWKFEEIKEE